MANVYSDRLFRAAAFNAAPTVFFTVPAGKIAVVRWCSIIVGHNAFDTEAWIEDDEGGRLIQLFQHNDLGNPPAFLGVEMRATYLPGETLSPGTNSATTADFHCAGYLLSLP